MGSSGLVLGFVWSSPVLRTLSVTGGFVSGVAGLVFGIFGISKGLGTGLAKEELVEVELIFEF